MQTSIFIAKMFAVIYLFIGLGMLMSPGHYKKMMDEIMKNAGILYFGAILATLAGFLIITFHNVWEGWPIIITIFGWLALVKGFALFVFPSSFDAWMKYFKKINMAYLGVVVLALGLLFGYFGFMA